MKIEYRISKDGKCEYSYLIRTRIEELKSNECDTEAAILRMAEKYAKNHECIDCILQIVYCSLNNVPSNEVFGFCEMYSIMISIMKTAQSLKFTNLIIAILIN